MKFKHVPPANLAIEEHIASSTAAGLVTESNQSKAIVDCNVVSPVATEELSMEKDLETLAKSSSPEPSSLPLINPETSLDSSETDTQLIGPSIAISCPAVVSVVDPPSTRLRHMIANSPSIILCPGVYDGLSARIAIHLGFRGMYMTGAGTTASCLGASDLGIAHLHDMRTNAEMIANLQPDGPPLIADMDTGYGGPLVISRAVKQYARAGVAAFHIEDQVPEKRCGHLSGKEVVDVDTYLRRIRACMDARAQIRSDIIIIARTDALQSRGYDDCIDRLRRARDLGADMGILEGIPSKEMAAQAVKDLAPWPLCYNSVENGHSPLITAAEAQEMGYRLMIFSFAGIAPAYMAIMETFTRLKEFGVTGSMVGPKKIFEVCGLEEEIRIDEAAGGSAFAKGV
jgi:methylisocitrate lyase